MKKLFAALVGAGLVVGSVAIASSATADVPNPSSSPSAYVGPTEIPLPSAPSNWIVDPTGCGDINSYAGDMTPTDTYTWSATELAVYIASTPTYQLSAVAKPGYVFVDNLGLEHSTVIVATHTTVQPYPDCDQPGTNLPNKPEFSDISSPTVAYGFRLDWAPAVENGTPVTGYVITAKVESNGGGFKTFSQSWSLGASATSLRIKSIKARARYYFTITATSALGNSRTLKTGANYTMYDPRIKANGPTKVRAVGVGARSAFLKWADPIGNGSYWGPWDWEVKVFQGKKLVKTHWTDNYSWDASGLARHTKYTYEVRGREGSMSTKWSAKRSFTTK